MMDMDLEIEKIFLKMQNDVERMNPINAKLKFLVGENLFVIDGRGTENLITNDDSDVNCTIITDMDTLMNLKKGNTDAVSELMEGNIDIKGDMALAFRLKSLLHF